MLKHRCAQLLPQRPASMTDCSFIFLGTTNIKYDIFFYKLRHASLSFVIIQHEGARQSEIDLEDIRKFI